MDIRTQLKELNNDLNDIREETEILVQSFHQIADKLDNYTKHGRNARLVGSLVAIGGGVLCVTGIGLIFVGIGLSLGVTVLGGILCGAGGATSSLQEKSNVTTTHVKKDVSQAVERYNNKWSRIKERALRIGQQLQKQGDIDYRFSRWCEFWCELLSKGKNTGEGKTWNYVVQSLQKTTYSGSGSSIFRAGRSSENDFSIGVFGDDVDGIDSYLLLDSGGAVDKKMLKKISKSLKQLAGSLESGCPSKSDIHYMVDETLERLR